MGFRVPTSARRPFRIDVATTALITLGIVLLGMAPAILRKGLMAPTWLVGLASGLVMSTQVLAPLWAAASHRRAKVPFIRGGALAAATLTLTAAGLVYLLLSRTPGAATSRLLGGASPAALLLFALTVSAFLATSGFNPLLTSAHSRNYPVLMRARIVARLNRFRFAAALPLAIVAALMTKAPAGADPAAVVSNAIGSGLMLTHAAAGAVAAALVPPAPTDVDTRYLWLLAVAGLALLGASVVYRRQRIAGEEDYPPGVNVGELLRRLVPTNFFEVFRDNPHYARFQVFQTLHGSGNIVCIPAFILVLTDDFQMGYINILILQEVLPSALVISTTTFWAPLMDRLPPARARVLNSPLWVMNWLVFFAAATTGLAPLAYVARTFAGLARSGSMLIWGLGPLYYARRKDDAPHLLAAHNFLTGVRGIVMPMIGVALYGLIGNFIFLVGACMMVTSTIGFYFVDRAEKRDPAFQEHLKAIGAARG